MHTDITVLSARRYGNMTACRPPRPAPIKRAEVVTNSQTTNGKRPISTKREPGGGGGGGGDEDDRDHDDEEEREDELRRKRSRGRPRLDTKDETAADRRRTQIRLAQRAYRHRKDTAITTLEQKVKELEQANENIGKDFADFFDFVVAEGMLQDTPHVARRLRTVANKLVRLTPRSTEVKGGSQSSFSPGCHDVDVTERSDMRCTETSLNSSDRKHSPPEPGLTSESMAEPDPNASSSFSSATSLELSAPVSYEIVTKPTPYNASFPFYGSMESQAQASYMAHAPNPSPFNMLPAPSSYASQERTFGRRLQRTTLESGFRLASSHYPPPDRYAAVFGLSLLFESRDAIIRRLAASLSRSEQESMSHWAMSPASFGGTGLDILNGDYGMEPHEGTRASQSLPVENQETRQFYKLGGMAEPPLDPVHPHAGSPHDERADAEMRTLCQGLEDGDFFDSDEIEMFLRQVGITIPPHADFIEAEIDVNDLRDDSETGGRGQFGDMSMTSSNSTFVGIAPQNTGEFGGIWPSTFSDSNFDADASREDDANSTQPLCSMPSNDTKGVRNADGGLIPFMSSPNLGRMWASGSSWSRLKVTISVSVLIAEMVGKSVCLGQIPRVRPKDVRRAVKIAAGLTGDL